MSEYNQDEKTKDRSIFEILNNATGDNFINAEEILAEGLDRPNWHLRYARNIIYLILVAIGAIMLESFFFPTRTLAEVDTTLRMTILALVTGITCICGFFDNILDQESTEVRWFNYARFWFVLLTFGSLTVYIAMMAIGTIANF